MNDIDFLRLTTDICYIIGSFFGGEGPRDNLFPFMQDSGDTVWLDMNHKMIFITYNIIRLQHFALDQVANDYSLGIDIYDDVDKSFKPIGHYSLLSSFDTSRTLQ